VGVPSTKLVLGKHSGRHAFHDRLEALGYHLEDPVLDEVFAKFKVLADKKKEIYDEDLTVLVEDVMEKVPEKWSLISVQTVAGGGSIPTATVRLLKRCDGVEETVDEAGTGDGPLDAAFAAIQRVVGVPCTLSDYQLKAVTGGKEAQGQVSLEITLEDGTKSRGIGISTDIIEASAKAYMQALNRVGAGLAKRQRRQSDDL
jgi:2-isopropylmalate synthase